MAKRWDTDEQGSGVGNARALLPDAKQLMDAMDQATWVAENPELHLLPHLQTACAQLPVELLHSTTTDDGAFVLDVRCTDPRWSRRAARTAAFALVGAVVESATFIRERREDDVSVVQAATGSLPGDSEFAPHGHVLIIRVHPAAP